MIIDRKNNLVSGFNFNSLTVSKVVSLFENDVVYIRVYDANNTMIKNTNNVTTGCTVRLIDASGNVIDLLTVVIHGDVNGDGYIDGRDSVITRAIAGGMISGDNVTAAQTAAADVNFDGTVTSIDAEHLDLAGLGLQTIAQKA